MRVEPYLYFDGRCDEAVEFYRRALAAEVVELVRFKDRGAPVSPENANKVMHVDLRIGETKVLASDGPCSGNPTFQGFSLALSVANDTEAERLFTALSDGGRVQVPLAPAPFASRFGMVGDRFGVLWNVVSREHNA